MKRLVYYNSESVTAEENSHLPGIALFSNYFKLYNKNVMPIDRSGTIRVPVKTASLFPLPEMRPFSKTFEEICNERAAELLKRADALNARLRVFYSGGIDSTLALISFLKCATPSQKKNIVVMMNENSISENPSFYREHIYGKLAVDSSQLFPYLIGGDDLIVNGEHGDQLFGADVFQNVIAAFGPDVIHRPYDRAMFFEFYDKKISDRGTTDFFLDMFERIKDAAPIDIKTNYEFTWWLNFTLKWQNVTMRMLPFVAKRNLPSVTREYMDTRFEPFYRTDDFQLWSMLNPDKKIKETWNTYKYAAKDVIFAFTRDESYHANKTKVPSLYNLFLQRAIHDFIDEDLIYHEKLDASAYFEPNNDFVA